ncbi:putative histone deacetylase complex subunit cti6 [Cyberlindnera fabianii]|uniref:Putative histone deacetylase complex subunit cti6 n=1 Tax=Cyberlindnera fabianii TaxID=36022 RepID=A0A1V2L3C3_CYBFA|nr:putative histone deacetylase complex subunit cti6 [Cyberlindnera fabianii]
MPPLRNTRASDSRSSRRQTKSSSRFPDNSEEPDSQGIEEDVDVDIEDDEEDDEEEAETRCICRKMDPPDADGLFIQCEKCSVWQHGFCVSIKDNVPEKYWCERCRPELHSIIVRNGEKISRYLPVQPKEKKPTRRGAKNAHVDEDTESATSKKQRRERATQESRYEAMIQRVMEESKKDAHSDSKSEDDDKPPPSSTSNSRGSRSRRRRNDDEEEEVEPKQESQDHDDDESMNDADTVKSTNSFKEPRVTKLKLKKDSAENDTSASDTQSTAASKSKPKKQKRTKGSNRSPQKEKDSGIDFNKPTKPRLPQQRTTINEMRRRVSAILEFIGRTQVDIAAEQGDKDELTKYVDDEESKKRIESLFDSYTGSLEQMDALTRKLLVWESKFGKYGDK